jgi:hypothetical protein
MKNLSQIIYQYKNSEFSWGEVDCCTFTFGIIEEFTGKNFPEWEVVTYNNEIGAMKALKKLGCKNLKDLPSIILGNPIKPIKEVKLGEPVYHINKHNGGDTLGICNGVRAYFLCDKGGITARKIEECEFCWSIN